MNNFLGHKRFWAFVLMWNAWLPECKHLCSTFLCHIPCENFESVELDYRVLYFHITPNQTLGTRHISLIYILPTRYNWGEGAIWKAILLRLYMRILSGDRFFSSVKEHCWIGFRLKWTDDNNGSLILVVSAVPALRMIDTDGSFIWCKIRSASLERFSRLLLVVVTKYTIIPLIRCDVFSSIILYISVTKWPWNMRWIQTAIALSRRLF